MNDPIPERAVTGLLAKILTALDAGGADHVAQVLRGLLGGPAPTGAALVAAAAGLHTRLAEMPAAATTAPPEADPEDGPFASRPQAEAAFAAFRDAALRGTSGPPGEQLVFTTGQHLADAVTDTIEDLGGEVGRYDFLLITQLAGYLDPVDVGVLCSWLRRVAPEAGQ